MKSRNVLAWVTTVLVIFTALASADDLCTAQDGPETYDLAPLIVKTGFWESIYKGFFFSSIIQFNMCNMPTSNSNCGNDGSCKIEGITSDKTPITQGPIDVLSSGHLAVNFTDDNGQLAIAMVLSCDLNQKETLGEPQVIAYEDKVYTVLWETAAACPVTEVRGKSCRVRDEVTGYSFDARLLGTVASQKVTGENGDYYFTLCGNLDNDPCGKSYGSCFVPKGATAGINAGLQAKDSPMFVRDGKFYKKYLEGAACAAGGQRTTFINFVCPADADAVEGPALLTDDNCAITIQWVTREACEPEMEAECRVADPATMSVYDLSDLTRYKNNWEVVHDKTTYELNVCRSVVPDPKGRCPSGSGACQAPHSNDESISGISMGNVAGPFFQAKSGHIIIRYRSGAALNWCDPNVEAMTTIVFKCKEGSGLGEPKWAFQNKKTCNTQFIWETDAACPQPKVIGAGCRVTDPIDGFQYDLTSLAGKYSVKSNSYTYELSICDQPLDCDTNAGGCQGDISIGELNQTPEFDGENAMLHYIGGSNQYCNNKQAPRETEIIFYCDPTVGKGVPKFELEREQCIYVFSWYTSAVCPPDTVEDCGAYDPLTGNTYDLSPLENEEQNYVANDEREGGKYEYQLNVCRALVPEGHTCHDNMGACQIYYDGGAYNDKDLGQTTGPQVVDGKLILHYENGTQCSGGKPRSTHVSMICPKDSDGHVEVGVLQAPVFLYEDDCEYFFEWTTSVACPLEDLTGEDCKVTDPATGVEFDLSGLATKNGNTVTEGDTTYQLNPCGTVKCGGVDVGACMTQAGQSRSIGQPSTEVEWNEEELTMTYTGGVACTSNSAQLTKTIISFLCDVETGKSGPYYDTDDEEECVERFEWYTPQACEYHEEVECFVVDPITENEYDLTELMDAYDNYQAEDSREDSKYLYEINICRTVVPIPGAKGCHHGAAACQISDTDADYDARDLGHLSGPPQFKDGELFIEYTDGDYCEGLGVNRTTYIQFLCNPDVGVGQPIFLTERKGVCEYIFTWETTAACTITGGGATLAPSTSEDICTVIDPVNKYQYNLQPLMGQLYNVSSPDSDESGNPYEYRVGVCEALAGSDCPDNTGLCRTTSIKAEAFSFGKVSTTPGLYSEQVSLRYEGGSPCPTSTVGGTAETLILFYCNPTIGDGAPVFHDVTEECLAVFHWETSHVCTPAQIEEPCYLVHNHKGYNLGALTRPFENLGESGEGNWVGVDTRAEGYLYELNVCHSLENIDEADNACTGAAACQLKPGDPTFAKNLGEISTAPAFVFDSERRVLGIDLKYTLGPNHPLGEKCHGQFQRSTLIHFTCVPGKLGTPQFIEEDDYCTYIFNWETSAACSNGTVVGNNGVVRDSETGLFYDLSSLTDHQFTTDDYSLGVFAKGNKCPDNAGLCMKNADGWVNLGEANSQVSMVDDHVFVMYNNGEVCQGEETYSTHLNFVCVRGEDDRVTIEAAEGDPCLYFATVYTEAACRNQEETECVYTNTNTGEQFDLTPLTKTAIGQNWHADSASFYYYINVCQDINPVFPDNGCPKNSGICQLDKKDENARFNLGGITSPTMEDGNLVLNYINGDESRCPGAKVRKTQIKMTCDTAAIGNPIFVSEDNEGCVYHFSWATSAACPVSASTTTLKPYTAPTTPGGRSGSTTGGTTDGPEKKNPSGSSHIALIAAIAAVLILVVIVGLVLVARKRGWKPCQKARHYNIVSDFYNASEDAYDSDESL